MSDGKKHRPYFYVISSLIVLSLVLVIYYFPVSAINRTALHRLKTFLEAELGQPIGLQSVEIGWKSSTLNGLSLQLDKNGSKLEIDRITLNYDASNFIEELGHLEQLLTSVSVENPEINLVVGKTSADSKSKLIPTVKIPPNLYKILGRFTRLEHIDINNTVMSFDDEEKSKAILSEGTFRVLQQEGVFTIAGTGYLLGDTTQEISFDGNVNIPQKQLDVSVSSDIHSSAVSRLVNIPYLKQADGRFHLSLQDIEASAVISAQVDIDSVSVALPFDTLQSKDIAISLQNDSLVFDTIRFFSSTGTGAVKGLIDLSVNPLLLKLEGNLFLDEQTNLQKYDNDLPDLSQDLFVSYSVSGSLSNPIVAVSASCEELKVFGTNLKSFESEASYENRQINIQELTFLSDLGESSVCGVLALDKQTTVNATAKLSINPLPNLLGLHSKLKQINLTATGLLSEPQIFADFCNDSGKVLCKSEVTKSGGEWNLLLNGYSDSKSSNVTFKADSGQLSLSLENAQNLFRYFYDDPGKINLDPISSLDLLFAGNFFGGDCSLKLKVKNDSTQFWTEIAKEFNFSGEYSLNADSSYKANGYWSGVNSYNTSFTGRTDINVKNGRIGVKDFFVDETGTLSGYVDITNQKIDLTGKIDQLSFDKFPFKPKAIEKSRLKGTLSGNLSVSGNLKEPDWEVNISMINGSIFDVEDYWLNAELKGKGLKADLELLELGRNTLKIIQAKGSIDVAGNTISVSAEAGAAKAEDFLIALTGTQGLISGELSGSVKIFGKLSSPDITSEVSVTKGKLFGDIVIDEFKTSFASYQDSNGLQTLSLPTLSFYREGKYYFNGSLLTNPVKGGQFQAHFDGNGNFLDIVDQFDRTFTASDGDGNLSVEFGGTFDKPELREGRLSLKDGYFSFIDATPVTVKTDIDIEVSAPGNVDHGNIHFSSGDQVLDINLLPVNQSSNPELKPLIIPVPKINLGVIEVTTTEDGFPIHLPGFMKDDWIGNLSFGNFDSKPLTISGFEDYRLLIQGQMGMKNARVTFPFISSGSKPKPVARWLLERLKEAKFNVDLNVSAGNHYDVEITGLKDSDAFAPLRDSYIFSTLADYFDHLSIDALISPTESPLEIRETIADSSFHILGKMYSYRGKVEYLDQSFDIDYTTADFDGTTPFPILEGRAVTYGVDSLSRRIPVYLTMYQVDRETKTRYKRGRFNNITFVLETENSNSPEEALSLLGYGAGNVSNKASEVVTATVARLIGRQWLEPIERRIEQWTPLDEVTFVPGGGRTTNLARLQREQATSDTLKPSTLERLYSGSQVTLGKYLGNDLYLSYTGELLGRENTLEGTRLGFLHFWNLEYRVQPLSPDLVLDFAIEYDEIERKRDESVSLKYTFTLEP